MKGPVGWFPDPDGGNGLRYFDGTEWTQIAPPPAPAPAAAPAQPVSVVVNNTNTVGTQDNSGCAWAILAVFFAPVLIGAFVVWPHLFWVPILFGVVWVVAYGLTKVNDRQFDQRHGREKLSARAEVENELFLRDDPRGTYGKYPPPMPPIV